MRIMYFCFLLQPEAFIPPLLEQIKDFGKLSGYTVNWQKCERIPLNEDLDTNFLRHLPVKVTTQINYLGTVIPKQSDQLFSLNNKTFFDKLRNDIGFWRTLPMSMVGRFNAIKMVTLPKFLYKFQNLPISLSKKFFKTFDSIILPFIWGYNTHRVNKKHLFKSKELGGLTLPIFQHYYWSANAQALLYWHQAFPTEPNKATPAWLAIEQDIKSTSLSVLRNAVKISPGPFKGIGFVAEHSLKVWYQTKKTFNLANPSIFATICHNHAFHPAWSDVNFYIWKKKGLATVKYLYIDNVFASFDQLNQHLIYNQQPFFFYLQVRNYAKIT